MGTNQLLLIVLGGILVILAVTIGINLFTTSYEEQVGEMMLVRINEIGAMANAYWRKPSGLGGGNRSYKGFELSNAIKETDMDWVKKVKGKKNQVNIYLMSNSKNSENKPIYILAVYKPYGIHRVAKYDYNQKKWVNLYRYKAKK